ncbi:family 20 glycosylhydrolase [Microbacterium esteraromaticum]|uniref:family 20 glycosylhydrolase n=1 Tax=Microbacterium esteraromaticum TaxID=57043 RepID=UPI00195B2CF1|nr:family 20 glycosylhydrolase [Microbacterium esteraromaticum]MBM7465769.1 hexosaminidase [Microbacterium esteraromaticum]
MTGTAAAWLALPQPSRFVPAGGCWRPASATVQADGPEFADEAARLQQEFADLGIPPGEGSRIALRESTTRPSREAFAIDVGDDIVIEARTAAGAFRAARQLLHNLRAQEHVPHGRVESAPAVSERGIHLDAARKHYPADWIIALLHDAADVGVNVLQWHFSENEGFRLASDAFPEVVSPDHITAHEARRIVETARSLHIDVVPSLDMPGHLGWVLNRHPELRMPASSDPYALVRSENALDITRGEAVDFARALIDDMVAHFPHSTRWNLGGDEFVDFARIDDHPALAAAAIARHGSGASGFDLLTGFVNEMAAHLRRRGFTTRVWNDGMLRGSCVRLDPGVELTWWTNWHAQMRPLADALAAGHSVVNVSDAVFYYVLGENAGYRYPTAMRVWEADWHPGLFPSLPDSSPHGRKRQEITQPYPPQLRGCSFAMWADDPGAQTPAEVAAGVRGPLRAMAERGWNGGSRLTLEEFSRLDDAVGTAVTRVASP